jgi:hypothetical protein
LRKKPGVSWGTLVKYSFSFLSAAEVEMSAMVVWDE